MPKRVSEPRNEQLLLRLTSAEKDVIDAAAYLQGVTPNSYVRSLVESHVIALDTNEFVSRVRQERDAYRRAEPGATALPSKASSSPRQEVSDIVETI